jgi:ABC-type transport system involved in cytochrome bd biosynthesis fused ATPase/permease subunit
MRCFRACHLSCGWRVSTEAKAVRAQRDAARERTLMLIAHRLGTVRRVDHLVVLQRGRAADDGAPPGEVLEPYRDGLEEALAGEG